MLLSVAFLRLCVRSYRDFSSSWKYLLWTLAIFLKKTTSFCQICFIVYIYTYKRIETIDLFQKPYTAYYAYQTIKEFTNDKIVPMFFSVLPVNIRWDEFVDAAQP